MVRLQIGRDRCIHPVESLEMFGDPLREIHAGSGYWSQDSAVQIFGFREAPQELEVRWPNGRITRKTIPAPRAKLKCSFDGLGHSPFIFRRIR
jgi:hypothetical protein